MTTRKARWRKRLALLPLVAALAACGPASERELLERGRAVYNFRCYFCHGYSGDAKTLAATYLTPRPRDFTRSPGLTRQAIADAVEGGREGSAMKSFRGILEPADVQAVAAFVEREFVHDKAPNTAYHTPDNGWPEHQRFAVAFPFAKGDIALDASVDGLTAEQQRGRSLFMSACVSCHDRARVVDEGPAWSSRPLSYPRMGFVPGQQDDAPIDAVSGASAYAKHEVMPKVDGLSAKQKHGERLFQANCAFCHGADGTGKNWIGQFMEPKARDLSAYTPQTMPPVRLTRVIREGLPGTSMPAWRDVLAPDEVEAVASYVTRVLMRPE